MRDDRVGEFVQGAGEERELRERRGGGREVVLRPDAHTPPAK